MERKEFSPYGTTEPIHLKLLSWLESVSLAAQIEGQYLPRSARSHRGQALFEL